MTPEPVEKIEHNGRLIALILRMSYDQPGLNFLTDDDSTLQLGQMKHPAGYEIQPHRHLKVERSLDQTCEVLMVRRGRVRVDLYTPEQEPLGSRELGAGDLILLAHGGHGFSMLEDSDIVEVKQGPYAGADDKVKFKRKGA